MYIKGVMNITQLEYLFKAFANRRRLAIIIFLSRSRYAPVYEIAHEIKLSFKATSKHLLILKSRDIVDSFQESLEQKYFLKKPINNFVKQVVSISNSRE